MREGWTDTRSWVAAAEEIGLDEVPGHGLFEGRIDDVFVRVWLRGHLRLRAFVEPPYGLQIVGETVLSRLGQRVFGKDLQVGHPQVDDQLHITARYEPGSAQRLVSGPSARDALAKAVAEGWTVTLLGTTLDLVHPAPGGPAALREGIRHLLRLTRSLDPVHDVHGNDRSSIQAVAERYGLVYGGGSVHGLVDYAWLRVDETRIDDLPHVRIQTTIPALLELTIRRREPDQPAKGIGDPILDAAVRISALTPESARELLCHEPTRGCVLELVHGAGATLDGGRLELTVLDDPLRVLGLIDTALTLREATDPTHTEAGP